MSSAQLSQLSLDFTGNLGGRRYVRPPLRIELRDGEPTVVVWIADHGSLVEMLCSPEDRALAEGHSWRVNTKGYAVATLGGRPVRFHSLVLKPGDGLEVDHIGERLDNRRSRLRAATHAQNMANRCRPKRNKFGRPIAAPFRGVRPRRGRYDALLTHGGRQYSAGTYDTPEAAARAYDAVARERFGAFARLNFPFTETLMHANITLKRIQEHRTNFAFAEVGADGNPVSARDSAIGTIYLKKGALGDVMPDVIEITIKTKTMAA